MNTTDEQTAAPLASQAERAPYEAPRITAAASLERVTLFSGGVVDGGIILGD